MRRGTTVEELTPNGSGTDIMREHSPALFLFKSGRRDREASGERYPTELFYGYPELRRAGFPVEYIERSDLGLDCKVPFLFRVFNHFIIKLTGINAVVAFRLGRRVNRDRLNGYGTLFATNNSFGMAIALLIRLGLVRAHLVYLIMGLVEPEEPRLRRWFLSWLLRDVTLAAQSWSEVEFLCGALDSRVNIYRYVLGVDLDYWSSGALDPTPPIPIDEPFVFSIGNDGKRDFATLVKAWRPEFPRLVIVTGLPVPAAGDNVTVLKGDWHRQSLSDANVRDLIRRSLFVITPTRQTIQPSGNTTTTQAMACGKAVIVSDIWGLWRRDLLFDGKTCLLVAPGDAVGLAEAVRRLVDDAGLATSIGDAAGEMVANNLGTREMTRCMAELFGYC